MTELVIHQIQAHIAATVVWDPYAWLTLDLLHKRLKSYIEPAKGFIVPGQIASLLTALDFKNSLPPEDPAGRSFATVADLQRLLAEEARNLLPTADSLAASFDAYELPEIGGRTA
jgi:hypothetical protein